MSNVTRWPDRGRVFVAILLCAEFFWALILSVCPRLHERVHPDAHEAGHTCAVTMIASGNCDHSPAAPLIRAPVPTVEFFQRSELSSVWVQSVFLGAHVFEHAPPVIA